LLLIHSSTTLLIICKYRDSNMFGNHFRILNARMVQSVESVWTVLYYVSAGTLAEFRFNFGFLKSFCNNKILITVRIITFEKINVRIQFVFRVLEFLTCRIWQLVRIVVLFGRYAVVHLFTTFSV